MNAVEICRQYQNKQALECGCLLYTRRLSANTAIHCANDDAQLIQVQYFLNGNVLFEVTQSSRVTISVFRFGE